MKYAVKDYKPAGPGRMRCLRCGKLISTNALARASHDRMHAREPAKVASK